MEKRALITGITGQDGSYLAEFLLKKGYVVHGMVRRSSGLNRSRIQHLLDRNAIQLHYGDMTETESLSHIICDVGPDEVYNLAAQSHVGISFETPKYTSDVNAAGVTQLLEVLRQAGCKEKVRFYQASTSELFGLSKKSPQNEDTAFHPRSPYAVSKLHAYWSTVNYREAHNLYTCNGILFNHESPRRGENFVTRKITRSVARIALGQEQVLCLGNLNTKRDWGHARDYVEGMWMMLQQDNPGDYVLATGESHSIREFASIAFQLAGIDIEWKGEGVDEQGIVTGIDRNASVYRFLGAEQPCLEKVRIGDVVVRIEPGFFRPAEVYNLVGDASKAQNILGWQPVIGFFDLVREMVEHDLIQVSGGRNAVRFAEV